MTVLSHETPRRSLVRVTPELWPSLAIAVIWIVVMLDALFGPAISTDNAAGTNTSSVPSAVVTAFFAFLATWVVARYGFRREHEQ